MATWLMQAFIGEWLYHNIHTLQSSSLQRRELEDTLQLSRR